MKTSLLLKQDGLIYVSDGKIEVLCQDQEQAMKFIVRNHSNGNLLQEYKRDHPYPIPNLRFEVTCKWQGNLDACGNETCWDLCECQKNPQVAILSLEEDLIAVLKNKSDELEAEDKDHRVTNTEQLLVRAGSLEEEKEQTHCKECGIHKDSCYCKSQEQPERHIFANVSSIHAVRITDESNYEEQNLDIKII